MNKKYNIRYIEEKDLDIIHNWWVERNEEPVKHDLLPQGGLGGLIIEDNNNMIAACFIYLTNSKMGYIDHLVSNPDYKGKGFWHYPLMKACFDAAEKSGCNDVWGTSSVRGVLKLLERYGCKTSEDPHYIIWSNRN
jgi:hypothetical protein